jgi:hypothetical protein
LLSLLPTIPSFNLRAEEEEDDDDDDEDEEERERIRGRQVVIEGIIKSPCNSTCIKMPFVFNKKHSF